MPQAIPRGLTRDHVLLALTDLDAGMKHPFGEPTKYELVHDEMRYAPKAAIGLAYRHMTGALLPPDKFSGGEAPGQANFVLRRLGFAIVTKGDPMPRVDEGPGRRDWSESEVALVVADYFAMLQKELRGESYSKAEHNAALRTHLAGRTKQSVEFKHANISAVLDGLGLPYIRGYKPRSNYQELLAVGVRAYLSANPGYLDLIAESVVVDPPARPAGPVDPDSTFKDPPDEVALPVASKPWVTRRVTRHIDFAERDAGNRRLGRMGEEFVVELEKNRLDRAGRPDLARRVDWVSTTVGDGLGYDVESFDGADGTPLRIEVKTTGLGKFHPFYVTDTEVRCSEDEPACYHLYRVFEFSRGPRVYILQGSLRERCQLHAVLYRTGL